MLEGLRHRTTALAQRGLAIDALHRKLDIALGRLEGVESLSPSMNQLSELGDNFLFVRNEETRENFVSSAEIIRELRNRDYFWNIVVFRVEAKAYVRFATNLASAPQKAWGNMLFFRDHNVSIEAFRWCQGALPRLQALPLGKSGRLSALPAKDQHNRRTNAVTPQSTDTGFTSPAEQVDYYLQQPFESRCLSKRIE